MADHQMPGNGVEQHFQTAAGAVLGQHLDKLDADDDVQAALKKVRISVSLPSTNSPGIHRINGTALKTSPPAPGRTASTSNRLEACMIRLRSRCAIFSRSFREERLAEESIGFQASLSSGPGPAGAFCQKEKNVGFIACILTEGQGLFNTQPGFGTEGGSAAYDLQNTAKSVYYRKGSERRWVYWKRNVSWSNWKAQ